MISAHSGTPHIRVRALSVAVLVASIAATLPARALAHPHRPRAKTQTTVVQTTTVQTTSVPATTETSTTETSTTAPSMTAPSTVPSTTVQTTTVQTPSSPPTTSPTKCPPGASSSTLCESAPPAAKRAPPTKTAPAPKPTPSTTSPAAPNSSALPGYPALSGELSELTDKALHSLIDLFPVPPFLLPIYEAAANDYDVPWEVLAAINEVETDYGRNLSISSAGAIGWMQFLPSTWAKYGFDADDRGTPNPYDPIDAIFAAARYLHAAGAEQSLAGAIFAYNHASWYVNSVLLRATLLRVMPAGVVDGLTGLMQADYPIAGHLGPAATQAPSPTRIAGEPAVELTAPAGAPVIAVADGHVLAIGHNRALGRYVTIEDSYGNRFTYSRLGSLEQVYPVLQPQVQSVVRTARELDLPAAQAASKQVAVATKFATSDSAAVPSRPAVSQTHVVQPAALSKERLFANPLRPASYSAGGWLQLQVNILSYAIDTAMQIGTQGPSDYFSEAVRLKPTGFKLAALRPGAIVVAGTVLGHVERGHGPSTGIVFGVRPAGASAPIDPRPIIAGWELLGRLTAGRAALVGAGEAGAYGTRNVSLGQLLLGNKHTLERAVLSDRRVTIVGCGRRDIEAGRVDPRVLAVIEYLSYTGFAPGVSGLVCGEPPGSMAQPGTAIQISDLDGIPVAGHQGDGGIVDQAIRTLLQLQGALRPEQIVSTRRYPWQTSTTALPGATRLEIDFAAPGTETGTASSSADSLTGSQWRQLNSRLEQLAGQPGAASPFATAGSQTQ